MAVLSIDQSTFKQKKLLSATDCDISQTYHKVLMLTN